MNELHQLGAMIVKEWRVFSKDKSHLFTIFLLPILIAGFFGAMNAGGGDLELPVTIVNLDDGQYSEDMLDVMRDIDELKLQEISSPEIASTQVEEGDAVAAIIIPAGFSQKIDDYEQTEVQVLMDPAQAEYGRIITSVMEEVIEVATIQGEMKHGMSVVSNEIGGQTANEQRASDAQSEGVVDSQTKRMMDNPPVALVKEDLEGAEVKSPDNIFLMFVPGFTVMFSFFLMPVLAEHLLKEKEEGSLRRLVAAPVSRGVIIGGKVAAYMVVVILQVALIFGISSIIFKMPLGSAPLGLFLITVAVAAAATALGMMIAALSKSKSQASSVGLLLVFVLAGLGGSIQLGSKPLPLYRYENFMGIVSRFTPHAQALEGYMRLLAENARTIDILPQTGILLGMAAIFFVIAVWRFKFEG